MEDANSEMTLKQRLSEYDAVCSTCANGDFHENRNRYFCLLNGGFWRKDDFCSYWEEDDGGVDFVLNPVTPIASARCPKCGEEFALYEGDTDVCPYCGSKMEVEKRHATWNYRPAFQGATWGLYECPSCGSVRLNKIDHCPNCGMEMEVEDE